MSLRDKLDTKSGILRNLEKEFADIYNLYKAKEKLSTEESELIQGMEIAIQIIGYYENELEMRKNNNNEMSPIEAIELMKSLGMEPSEIKELVKEGIKHGSK